MKTVKFFIKRQLIRVLRSSRTYVQKAYLPAGIRNLQSLTEDYQLLYRHQAVPVTRKPPIAVSKVHKSFIQKLTSPAFNMFVLKVHNWRIWGNQGAVITTANFLLAEASREFDNKIHSVFHQYKLVKPELLNGLTAILAASGANIYYHWMFDVLPRVDLLKQSGTFNNIKYFVINCVFNDFQKETLEKVGVVSENIIQSLNHWKFHLQTAELIIPSLVSPNDYPSLEACRFLRSLFLDEMSEPGRFNNIYIQRTSGRKVENEDELISFLIKKEFEIIQPERLSVAQQARIFSGAKVVIGAHGSAFTNIVFCQPSTIVIELFALDWVNPCYWMIAEHMQLRYGYLMSSENRPKYSVRKSKNTNIKVDISQLSTLLTVMHEA